MKADSSTKRRPRQRDIEKEYPLDDFIAKLRRLADTLEQGKPFTIQIARERIRVPAAVTINIEHERGETDEEIEFQLVWKRSAKRQA